MLRQYSTLAQDVKAKVNFFSKKLIAAMEGRDFGLAGHGIQDIEKIKKELTATKKVLALEQSKAKWEKKYRNDRKKT